MTTLMIVLIGCNDPKEIVVMRDSMLESSVANKDLQVTKEYGSLSVNEGEFTGTSQITPWSSWWFPTKDKYLFESSNEKTLAPLQKYDAYNKENSGVDSESALFERMEIYDPSEVNWAGLCHAWAIASVLHVEPKVSIIKNNISFSVADQKALLLKSYESPIGLKFYGKRNNGGFEDDFNDIYPDQFHRMAQVFLFERKLPFLMDYDPRFPVWTVPIYNIKFKIVKLNETSALVKAWLSTASPNVDSPNFVGTKKSVKFYEYKLYGQWTGGALKVTNSEWVNDSVFDHPDYLIAYPDAVKRQSLNLKLDVNKINEIIGKNYVEIK